MTNKPTAAELRIMRNLQTLYDTVARHLLRQAAPSLATLPKGGIGCAYRGNNGLKCAIGVLIPDRLYHPKMEGINGIAALDAVGLLKRRKHHTAAWAAARADLLVSLQYAHDDAHGVRPSDVLAFWERRLTTIAKHFDLRPFTRAMLKD